VPKITITSALVKSAICPPERKRVEFFDTLVKGFSLEVRPSGGRTFYLRYRDTKGHVRQVKIGDAQMIRVSDARRLAEQVGRDAALGDDPMKKRFLSRSVLSFEEFIEQQYLPYVRTYKRSWADDASLLKNHLLPRFGKCRLDEIARQDVQQMHQDRRAAGAAPGSANRLLILMRYIYNLALRWEVAGVAANPCKGIPLLEENNKKERYLSADEAERLYHAVCRSENPMLRYIVPMLILTGARKREVLDARWEDFNQARRIWRIPVTKAGKARYVPLSDGALNVLSSLPTTPACPWAFPNPETGRPYVSIFYAWDTARRKADLSDVRIHDLRHSFASLLINSGRTLYEVQQILGHTQVKTTQRYAHLSQDTLLAAANTATWALKGGMVPNS
jgi:integrase